MRSIVDLASARAISPLAFLGNGFGLLEALVVLTIATTGAFLCLVAYDLNTNFRRLTTRDAKRATVEAAGTRPTEKAVR